MTANYLLVSLLPSDQEGGTHMVLSPAMTWLFCIGGFGLVIVICAAAADAWGARVERTLRDQARAEARAKRREERELSVGREPF